MNDRTRRRQEGLRLYRDTGIPAGALDQDAVKVLGRLQRKGFETYLVGGCVRDLILGLEPKDFDVATEARPRQVKSAFRNSRVIGRRFKLAHVHFDGKIIEVSTFRRRPSKTENAGELLIREDNEFGTAAEDANRRDFTINGLFYDPNEDLIYDWVGGIEDLQGQIVRSIGDPRIRMREDPVRILRAIKFASRLGLRIEDRTWRAMCEVSGDLAKAAAPRILEEILRLLKSGKALRAFQMLRDCGALKVILPLVQRFLDRAPAASRASFWRKLEALDALHAEDPPPSTALCLTALFHDHLAALRNGSPSTETELARRVSEELGPLFRSLSLPRAEAARIRRLFVVQRRFDPKPGRRRSVRPAAFVRQEIFPEALRLFRIRCLAGETDWAEADHWSALAAECAAARPDGGGAPRSRRRGPSSPTSTRASEAEARGDGGPEAGRRPDPRRRRRKKKASGRRGAAPVPPPLPDIELDPHVVPTYGALLGEHRPEPLARPGAKRKRSDEEPYVPPPPPEEDDPLPHDDEPEVFGDW